MGKQMASLWSRGFVAIGSGVCATGLILNASAPANAQAAYGSYIGAGPAFGVTNGDKVNGERRETSGFFGVRYKFLRAPVSLRTQVLVGSNGTAVVPTVSYDFPLNWQTDLYVGAGASVVRGGNTAVGNKGAFVIQPGVDYALPNSNLMLFGNAIIAFDGYRSSKSTAVSIQAGAGLRF
jgi:hypothetical protein